jgi:hypothetical protein
MIRHFLVIFCFSAIINSLMRHISGVNTLFSAKTAPQGLAVCPEPRAANHGRGLFAIAARSFASPSAPPGLSSR